MFAIGAVIAARLVVRIVVRSFTSRFLNQPLLQSNIIAISARGRQWRLYRIPFERVSSSRSDERFILNSRRVSRVNALASNEKL